jgi:hypothetical protein
LTSRFEQLQKLYDNLLFKRKDIVLQTGPILQSFANYLRADNTRNSYDFKINQSNHIMESIKMIEVFVSGYSLYFYNETNKDATIWSAYNDFVKVLFNTNPKNIKTYLEDVLLDLTVFIKDSISYLALMHAFRLYKGAQSTADDLGFLSKPNMSKGAPIIPNIRTKSNGALQLIYNDFYPVIKGYRSASVSQNLGTKVSGIFKILQSYYKYDIFGAIGLCTDLLKLGTVLTSIQKLLIDLNKLINELIQEITGGISSENSNQHGRESIGGAQTSYIIAYLHLMYHDPERFGNNGPNIFKTMDVSKKINDLPKYSKKISKSTEDKFLTGNWDKIVQDMEFIVHKF